ncbi:heme-degrading domain-containing protein [Trinickia sp. NRRL B-1857]|uniref:heme-degrading domain-containing protein n=1 Tax=Trinickia sp. NRRL B-1857 TaxID=3162879 RepID=UPI003D2AD391
MAKVAAAPRIETFDEQAARTTLPTFGAEVARKLGEIAVNIAARRTLPIVVSVKSMHRTLFYCALEGSCADNDKWIRRKENTVLHFGKSSLEVGTMLRREGRTLAESGLSEEHYTVYGGGVPLRVASAGIVGVMSVSGLEDFKDHELVIETLSWHLDAK